MKQIYRRIIAIGVITLLVLAMAVSVTGADTIQSGSCGDTLTWTLDTRSGELVISGTGAMENYMARTAPWYRYRTDILTLTVEDGVTAIGNYALYGCPRLEYVALPDSLTRIGVSAFTNTAPDTVLYYGTEADWQSVTVSTGNSTLTDMLLHHPEHTFDCEVVSWEYLLTDADCENDAVYYKTCLCGAIGTETFSDVGSALGHTGGTATCAARAVCVICDKPYGSTLPHTPDGKLSCTVAEHCTACGTQIRAALGHDHTDTVTPPTCTESGYTTHVCARCHAQSVDAYTDPTGHTPGAAATCTAPQDCTVCAAKLADALGHDHKATVTTPPTCAEPGTTTHTCTRCADAYTTDIAPLGHTPGAEATCTAPQICTVCQAVLAAKTGHTYNTSVVSPTCVAGGYTIHTCVDCEAAYVDAHTDPNGHTPGRAATCTTPQFCTACDALLVERTGHELTETVVPPTCTESGYTRHTCSHCTVVYVDTYVEATGHTPGKAPTCHTPQTCTVCHALLADGLSHSYTDETTPPTCDEAGYTVKTCTRCDLACVHTVVPATGHTAGDWVTDREPTDELPGTRHKACTVCGAVLTTETIYAEGTITDTDGGDGDNTTVPPFEDTASDSDEDLLDSATTETATEDGSDDSDRGSTIGCRSVGGNILVILLFLLAAGGFWFVGSRRR